jgi:hypothetical protein
MCSEGGGGETVEGRRENVGERVEFRGERRVVVRCIWVVSALGGGGKEDRSIKEGFVEMTVARQRKHSPVPK